MRRDLWSGIRYFPEAQSGLTPPIPSHSPLVFLNSFFPSELISEGQDICLTNQNKYSIIKLWQSHLIECLPPFFPHFNNLISISAAVSLNDRFAHHGSRRIFPRCPRKQVLLFASLCCSLLGSPILVPAHFIQSLRPNLRVGI